MLWFWQLCRVLSRRHGEGANVRTLGRPHRDQVGVRVTDLDRGSGPLRSSRRRTQQDIHDGDCPSSLSPRSRWLTSAAGPHWELISIEFKLRDLMYDAQM